MRADNTLSIIGRIREAAYRHIFKGLQKWGHEGVAPSHGEILMYLMKHGECKLSEVADAINKDRSTVTTLSKKLIKLGYVESRKNPEDGRSSLVYLTAKGQSIYDPMIVISEELYDVTYKGISDEERDAFRKTLMKIYDNLK